MVKVIAIIPLNYNDGRDVPDEIFKEFEDQLIEIAGGYTLEGIVEGGWKDGDTVYRDRSKKYSIVTESTEDIKDLVLQVGKQLEQKAMYLEIISSQVEILEIK
jgi:hypothetical protein